MARFRQPQTLAAEVSTSICYRYADPAASAAGIQKLVYKAGEVGRSKILIKGRGASLPDGIVAALGSSSAVTVQVRASDGECMSMTLSDVKKRSDLTLKIK